MVLGLAIADRRWSSDIPGLDLIKGPGSDRSFIAQPAVGDMIESVDPPGMKEIVLTTIESDCLIDRQIKTKLMIALGVGGIVLVGLGGLLLLIRNLRGRQPQPWPPVR